MGLSRAMGSSGPREGGWGGDGTDQHFNHQIESENRKEPFAQNDQSGRTCTDQTSSQNATDDKRGSARQCRGHPGHPCGTDTSV